MFCSIMWRGVSLGVYINNPSYNHSVALSIVLGNHFTIGWLLILSQYLSVRTYSWLLWQQQINKLLQNDSHCIQDKLWSNLGERCGGSGPWGAWGTEFRQEEEVSILWISAATFLAWKVWKLKCEKSLICVFLILVSLKPIAINGNFRSKVMTLKIYFVPVYTIH